jgi:hypothetical protein
MGGMVAAIPAIQNFSQGNAAAGTGNLVGGVIGGALGSLIAPGMGTVIGASIGSGIAESFVKNVLQYKGEIGGAFAQAEQNAKDMAAAAAAKGGGTLVGPAEDKFMAVQEQILKSGGGLLINKFQSWFGNVVMGATGQVGKWNPEMVGYMNASPELQQQYEAANKALLVSKGQGGTTVSASARAQKQLQDQNASMAAEMQAAMQQQLLAQLTGKAMGGGKPSGSITSAQYTAGMQNISGFGEVAAKMSVAFGPQFREQATGIRSAKDEYQAFIDLLVYGGDTETKTLTELASQISQVTDNLAVNNLTITVNGEEVTKTREEWEKYLATLKLTAGASAAAMSADITFSRLKQPNLVGGNTPLQNVGQLNQITSYAQQLDEKRVRAANPGITDAQLAQYKSKLDTFITLVLDAGEEIYKSVAGVSSQAFQEAEAFLKQQGLVGRKQGAGTAAFQEINLPSSMATSIQKMGEGMQNRLKAAGMPLNPEDMVAYFNDDQFKSLHLDSVALRLVLEQILNTEQKQLDQGMWNVPAGADIMVSINSLWNATHNAAQGGGGWGGNNATEDTTPRSGGGTGYTTGLSGGGTGYMTGLSGGGVEGVYTPTRIITARDKAIAEAEAYYLGLRKKNEVGASVGTDDYAGRHPGATGFPGTPKGSSLLSQMTGGVFDKGGFFETFFNNIFKPYTGAKEQGSLAAPSATKLGLNLTSHMTIQLDGRIVASAIKVYLLNDLVAMSKAYGTTSKDYVI